MGLYVAFRRLEELFRWTYTGARGRASLVQQPNG